MLLVCLELCFIDFSYRFEDFMCYMLWYAYVVRNLKKNIDENIFKVILRERERLDVLLDRKRGR